MSSIRNRIRIPTRNVGGSFEGSRIRYPRIEGSESPTIRENSRIVTAIRWFSVTLSNCISIDSPPVFIDNLNYTNYTISNVINVIIVTNGMSRGRMSESVHTLVKDLFVLSGMTNLQLAKSALVFPSHLSSWLKHGKTTIGVGKQYRLLEALGVSGGTLRKDRVHVWNWKLKELDLGPLVRTLEWAGSNWEMITLAPLGRNITEWTFPLRVAFYDRNLPVRIYLRTTLSPLIRGADLSLFGLHILPPGKVHWRPRSRFQALHPSGRLETLLIDAEIFDEWEKGVVTVEDYDRILWKAEGKVETPKNLMKWESFGKILEKKGVFQRDILERFPEIEDPSEEK